MQWTLEQARVHRGLSQESVARKLNVSRQTYQNYENYRTTMQISTGYRFSEIVDIPFDDIIFFKPELHLKCI
ncbi:helix-turn-helix transcriptional regulator [Streptococcus suis]|uniref:helix-turn-helix transcriptional regulator n=1 Tax=Streptococcus suis TaxID=1307 RepID=UPI003D6564B4